MSRSQTLSKTRLLVANIAVNVLTMVDESVLLDGSAAGAVAGTGLGEAGAGGDSSSSSFLPSLPIPGFGGGGGSSGEAAASGDADAALSSSSEDGLVGGLPVAEAAQRLYAHFWRLQEQLDWVGHMDAVCDMSTLYWFPELWEAMVSRIFESAEHVGNLPWVLLALDDASGLLSCAVHGGRRVPGPAFASAFRESVAALLEERLVRPLCQEVENALRLQQHAATLDHMRDTALPRSLGPFLQLPVMHVLGKRISLRERVAAYLERVFYNMTVLALHDWRTYAEMRSLARENFGLELADSRLPAGSLDSGLDVLQIMRNIHVFVALYNYNLNEQYFVERRADRGAKHLNSINIQSVTNSIRTHGSGIMNTCVNFTYQFLAKRFYVFSQFLFDDHIKSYLMRERRWFVKHCKGRDVNHMYPFERAQDFNRDIRRLGTTKAGMSFLGQFRALITEIGNALGYVRMVRSAGMNWVSGAIQFVPDVTNVNSFALRLPGSGQGGEEDGAEGERAIGGKLSEEAQEAARNLDRHLRDLGAKFAEGTDYLKVLVDVFQQVMMDTEGNEHLDSFYMIVPSLIVNFVEAIAQAKDQLARAHKGKEAYFTDDGFAMGVAYVLSILRQHDRFDGLHWFRSVHRRFSLELEQLRQQLDAPNTDTEDLGAQERRIRAMAREYELVMFSFTAARIFFKQEDENEQ